MPARYGQSSTRGGANAMELSDSEDEDEMMMDHRNGAGNGNGNEKGEEEDLTQWTLDTFRSKPVGADAVNTIRTMYTKMAEPLDRVDETLRLYGDVAAAIADCDEKHHLIRHVQQQFLSTLETRYLIQIKIDVLKMLEEQLKQEAIQGIEQCFAEECAQRTEEWSKKSDRVKYKTDKQFEAFRQAIWEKNHPDEAIGPMSRFLEKGDDDEDDSDDEVEVGGTVKNYVCPLTMGLIKDAYTSQICGHSYTGPYIIEMIRRNKKQPTKCPNTGCPSKLRMEDIRPDPALQKHADEYAKKQQRRERETARAHDSEEEVLSE